MNSPRAITKSELTRWALHDLPPRCTTFYHMAVDDKQSFFKYPRPIPTPFSSLPSQTAPKKKFAPLCLFQERYPKTFRGDIEIQDYVILPRGEDDRLPPRTLVMDVTMTHDRYGRTTQYVNGSLSHRVSSTGAPQSDGVLDKTVRTRIRNYHIVKLVFWPENYLRDRSSFASCELHAWLILKDL
jgi:hypothetical protein